MIACPTLIVDDEPAAIARLKHLLENYPFLYKPKGIFDPLKAEETIRRMKPGLVFVDIEMPGMNGLELARKVRTSFPAASIIFVTSYNKYAIQAIKQSAFDYILKPVDSDELTESLDRFLEMRRSGIDVLNQLKKRYGLTPRETEITSLVRSGLTSDEIAGQLNISLLTVNTHRQNILRKTGCGNFLEMFY